MKRLMVKMSCAFVVAAAATGSASVARADDGKILAKVPFAFIVGDSRLPAGDYVIREASGDRTVMSIASADGRQIAASLTIPWSGTDPVVRPELVFEKFGGQYFLARIVSEDSARAIILTPARMERELVVTASKS